MYTNINKCLVCRDGLLWRRLRIVSTCKSGSEIELKKEDPCFMAQMFISPRFVRVCFSNWDACKFVSIRKTLSSRDDGRWGRLHYLVGMNWELNWILMGWRNGFLDGWRNKGDILDSSVAPEAFLIWNNFGDVHFLGWGVWWFIKNCIQRVKNSVQSSYGPRQCVQSEI